MRVKIIVSCRTNVSKNKARRTVECGHETGGLAIGPELTEALSAVIPHLTAETLASALTAVVDDDSPAPGENGHDEWKRVCEAAKAYLAAVNPKSRNMDE